MAIVYVFFDLDGTLTESAPGITNSVSYALSKFGISVRDKTALQKFIGPPLLDSFMNYYDMTKEEAGQAIEYYREYFGERGLFENSVYAGVYDMLSELKKDGKKLFVATSKPEPYTFRILDHFDLMKFFDIVAGATMDGSRCRKSDVLKYAIEKADIKDLSKAVMIGDRENDITGAKNNKIRSIGVLYGYGDETELTLAGADYIAKTPCEVTEYLRR